MKFQNRNYSVKRNPYGGLMLTYIPGGTASMRTLDDYSYKRVYGTDNTLKSLAVENARRREHETA